MKPSPTPKEIYQLKITLNDTHIPIWRRILIPKNSSFKDLHKVIQAAFSWHNWHLHHFLVSTSNEDEMYIVDQEVEEQAEFKPIRPELCMAEKTTTLADVMPSMAKSLIYEYDFGDDWIHTVLLEKTLPAKKGVSYPTCIGGENAGPPEDCGGTGRYEELCKRVANPNDDNHSRMVEWLRENDPRPFNPYLFDMKKTDADIRDCLMVVSSYFPRE